MSKRGDGSIVDRCVCCGEIIPEGSGMVCRMREENVFPEGVKPAPVKKKPKSNIRKILKKYNK